MGSGPKGSTRLLLGGMAAAGIVAAHLLAYLFAVPDPHDRVHVLESTGHGAWSYLAAVCLGLLVAGLLRYVVGSFRGDGELTAPFIAIAGRLAVLQLGGFLGLEALERLSIDHSVSGLFAEPAIQLGLLLQLAIALVGALVLMMLTRVIRSVLARRSQPEATSDPVRSFSHTAEFVRRSTVGTGSGTLRGPPLPA